MSWSRSIPAVAATLVLAACGFQLRGQATYAFDSIYISTPPAPTMANELRKALAAGGNAKVMDSAKDAQVVLDVTNVSDDKEVLTLSGAGSVSEYTIIKRVQFRLHDANGEDWLPPGEFSLRRTFSYATSEELARGIQEQRLWREMQTDAVQQLVRRLQAAKKPA